MNQVFTVGVVENENKTYIVVAEDEKEAKQLLEEKRSLKEEQIRQIIQISTSEKMVKRLIA